LWTPTGTSHWVAKSQGKGCPKTGTSQAHSTQYFAGRTMASGQYNNETVAEQTTLLNEYFSM